MLGVEHHREVEGLAHRGGRDLAVDHVQEIGGVIEIVAGRDQRQALGDPLAKGDGRRHLGDQPLGLADVGGVVGRRRVVVGVEMGQHAHRAAEHVHGMDVAGNLRDRARSAARVSRGARRRASNSRSWLPVGQIAVQEQERRLLVRDVTGQVFDPVSPVFQPTGPVRPLDVGDRRLACDHAFQAGMIFFRRRHAAHFGTPQNDDQTQDRARPKKPERRPRPITMSADIRIRTPDWSPESSPMSV